MSTIDRELVRALNSGQCFALVGSGPSCELGLPNWLQLAEYVVSKLDEVKQARAVADCRSLIHQRQFARVFSRVEQSEGRPKLIDIVDEKLKQPTRNGYVYKMISSWPFACYLTTNFDDCLKSHLKAAGIAALVKHNSLTDMQQMRASSKNIIFKIHGDCSTPNNIVLTEEAYKEFQTSPSREYWREKIKSCLHMVDLIIIGYSGKDSDFNDQLRLAKSLSSPNHPIFMFAADVGRDEVRKYYLESNIRIIAYANPDGTHSELKRVLRRYDPFIARRGSVQIGADEIDMDKAALASSLYIYTSLRFNAGGTTCLKKSYEATLFGCFAGKEPNEYLNRNDLIQKMNGKLYSRTNSDPDALQEALNSLHAKGYIDVAASGDLFAINSFGITVLQSLKAEREMRRERFQEACRVFINNEYGALTISDVTAIIENIEKGLLKAFEKRGAEMAKAAYDIGKVNLSTASDILDILNERSTSLNEGIPRAAYADLMIEVLLYPSVEMKEFLAELSQGFFSFHALGLDPKCSDERLRIAKEKYWILDSSMILPLLAIDCSNHEYAKDLFNKMQQMGFVLYSTARLFDEVIDHANWAIRNFSSAPLDSPLLLAAASVSPGYKQNLFLDGFMKWANGEGAPSLDGYFKTCFGKDYKKGFEEAVNVRIVQHGIKIVNFQEWPEFNEIHWADRDIVEKEILQVRQDRGSYRSDEQCRAEAEVVLLCENGKAAFISQSGVFDSINRLKHRITWRPENIYKFLSSFTSAPPSEEVLYQCMFQDFYYSGFDIVNRNAIRDFFSGPVNQARLKLDEEAEKYAEAIGASAYSTMRSDFETAPPEQKPFYSMQFAFFVANCALEGRKQAEKKVIAAQQVKELNEKERRALEKYQEKEKEKQRTGRRKLRGKLSSRKNTKKNTKKGKGR